MVEMVILDAYGNFPLPKQEGFTQLASFCFNYLNELAAFIIAS